MIKRLRIYLKEMYPLFPRLILSFSLYLISYLLILRVNFLNKFNLDINDWVGIITIFLFWLFLRLVDEFKDQDLDKLLFPQRPFPSGKVRAIDLKILIVIVLVLIFGLNFWYRPSLILFMVLMSYGFLMSFWFFEKKYIKPNLLLALITHNPVQLIVNFYLTSIICFKLNLNFLTLNIIVINFMLYFSGLIWEIGRKIKVPQEENNYSTYSKIFGYKKSLIFLSSIIMLQALFSSFIFFQFASFLKLMVLTIPSLFIFKRIIFYYRNPENKNNKIADITLKYIYLFQIVLVVLLLI